MHYGGETSGKNWERNGRILTPNELKITFWVPDGGAKFHSENCQNCEYTTVGG